MSIWLLTLLVWTHLIADFVLQTDKMAFNKSKSNYCLFIHVAVYSTVMLVFGVEVRTNQLCNALHC